MKRIEGLLDLMVIGCFLFSLLFSFIKYGVSVISDLLLWSLIILSTSWIHELGHALVLTISQIPIEKIILGYGPTLCCFKKLIEIRAILIAAGVDFSLDNKFNALNNSKKIMIFLSGSLANLIIGLIFIIPFLNQLKGTTEKLISYFPSFNLSISFTPGNFFSSLLLVPLNLINESNYFLWLLVGWFFIIAGFVNLLPIPSLDGNWLFSIIKKPSPENLKVINKKASSASLIIRIISKCLLIVICLI